MDGYGYGSAPRSSNGGDRRLEIVSGKGSGGAYNKNQSYTTRAPQSPRMSPVPPRVARPSQIAAKPWGFGDPEMKRKRRIAKYKVYTVEGKVKRSLRKGFCWIKNKCSQIIHGY